MVGHVRERVAERVERGLEAHHVSVEGLEREFGHVRVWVEMEDDSEAERSLDLAEDRGEALRLLGERVEDHHQLERLARARAREAHARGAARDVILFEDVLALAPSTRGRLRGARGLGDGELLQVRARECATDSSFATDHRLDELRRPLRALLPLELREELEVDLVDRGAARGGILALERELDQTAVGDHRRSARRQSERTAQLRMRAEPPAHGACRILERVDEAPRNRLGEEGLAAIGEAQLREQCADARSTLERKELQREPAAERSDRLGRNGERVPCGGGGEVGIAGCGGVVQDADAQAHVRVRLESNERLCCDHNVARIKQVEHVDHAHGMEAPAASVLRRPFRLPPHRPLRSIERRMHPSEVRECLVRAEREDADLVARQQQLAIVPREGCRRVGNRPEEVGRLVVDDARAHELRHLRRLRAEGLHHLLLEVLGQLGVRAIHEH